MLGLAPLANMLPNATRYDAKQTKIAKLYMLRLSELFHAIFIRGKPIWRDQVSNSLISSIRCIFFSSSLIMPSELALHIMVSDNVGALWANGETYINFFLS